MEYHFETNWRVKSSVDDVYDVLSKPLEFVRWWPEVYLDVELIKEGDENGLGEVVRLHTKGRLPYHLHWEAESLELDKPFGMTIGAKGDLEGKGIWKFVQDREFADIRYDWTVVPNISWISILTPFLRPVFESNHEWAMSVGERRLKSELARKNESEL